MKGENHFLVCYYLGSLSQLMMFTNWSLMLDKKEKSRVSQ